VLLADGKTTWLYIPAEKQARKSALKNLEDVRSPLAFLLGKTKLQKELKVLSFAPDLKAWKPEDVMLRGVPVGLEDRVEQVVLEITPEHRIARILIHAVDDSVTEYRSVIRKRMWRLRTNRFGSRHLREPRELE